ncbi:hypothetical protein BSKO_06878 [Bryopsis sp. KO-2023]|nr:hypothetical protein BSKO_06878 [Bryopsis sp. KO-2023]
MALPVSLGRVGRFPSAPLSARRTRLVSVRRPAPNPRASSAAGAGGAEDPYQVLGLPPSTSADNIQRVYKNKLRQAKIAGDDALVERIESAHSSLMMRQLTQRMQGGASVPKDIAFADKAVYLPWRPRWCPGPTKLALIAVALNGLLLAWALIFTTTAATQPLIASMLSCAAISYFKLEGLTPSDGGALFASSDDSRKQGGKNLLRCVVLPLMGTVAGVMICFTIPDLVSEFILSKKLPFWFYDNQSTVLNVGAIVMNTFITALFR